MNTARGNLRAASAAAAVLLAVTTVNGQELFEVPFENPSFAKSADDPAVPVGWSKYGGSGREQELKHLYTHRGPTPCVLVADVRLVGGLPPPPPPPPEPAPPQYDKLKDPCLEDPLGKDGRAMRPSWCRPPGFTRPLPRPSNARSSAGAEAKVPILS